MRHKRDINKVLTQETLEEYKKIINDHPAFAFCANTERIIRPYTCADFERDYFIPDL